MVKEMTCVACPAGCALRAELDDAGNITEISGHACKRGEEYARAEITNPARMFHSTVRVEGGAAPLVSVKSAKSVPKTSLLCCAEATKNIKATPPIAIGDVVLRNICGTGVDLIATKRVETKT